MSDEKVALASLLGILAAAGGLEGMMTSSFLRSGSRTNCVQCGKDIPPGKAGRRCAECRQPKTSEDSL